MNASMEVKEAKQTYKEYFSCPHGCGACYHVSSFTHNTFCCKDCNNEFSIPSSVKLNKHKPFRKPERKPEFKRGE